MFSAFSSSPHYSQVESAEKRHDAEAEHDSSSSSSTADNSEHHLLSGDAASNNDSYMTTSRHVRKSVAVLVAVGIVVLSGSMFALGFFWAAARSLDKKCFDQTSFYCKQSTKTEVFDDRTYATISAEIFI